MSGAWQHCGAATAALRRQNQGFETWVDLAQRERLRQ